MEIYGIDKLLKKYKNLTNIQTDFVDKISDLGVDVASRNYANRDAETPMPVIDKEFVSPKNVNVFAVGERLTFEEYGTGTRGKESNYPVEKLPQENIPITKKWVYNYPSKYKRFSKKTGEIFWFHKRADGSLKISTGQKAGMQMYNTALEIRKNAVAVLNNILEKPKGK